MSFAQPISVADSFTMGKQLTRLRRSEQFETVTFYEVDPLSGARSLTNPSIAGLVVPTGIGRVMTVPNLEDYGVLLIELAPGITPDALALVLRSYNSGPGIVQRKIAVAGNERDGQPIYSAGTVQHLLVNEVLVRFRHGTDPQANKALLVSFGARILRAPVGDQSSYLVQFPGLSGHETRERSNRLDASDSVLFAQPNMIVIDPQRLAGGGLASIDACARKCPDPVSMPSSGDPLLPNQWHLENHGRNGKKFADVNAREAWKVTRGDPSIVIAILDDFVEASHPDLGDKLAGSWNAITQNDSPPSLELTDGDGHGTAAAGLAAAEVGNGLGVAGIAPRVSIMRVRTHQPTSNFETTSRGIEYAADHAQVLSMSWTMGWAEEFPNGWPEMEAAIAYAVARNRVLVFAAGNARGLVGREADYPANRTAKYPIIAVSATNEWDALQKKAPSDGNCGWSSHFGVDTVAAPGVDLHTIDRSGSAGFCATGANDSYTKFLGTSAATPLVAGIVALMLSVDPELTPLEIRTRLQQTAEHPNLTTRPNDASGWGKGWGRVDACRALNVEADCSRRVGPQPPLHLIGE